MADPPRHRGARPGALARQSPTRGRGPIGARPTDGRGSDGQFVQGDRHPLAGLAGGRGVRMTVTYRDATPADAPALRELFAESFVETFGHLYRPQDLNEFLDGNSNAKWDAN